MINDEKKVEDGMIEYKGENYGRENDGRTMKNGEIR